MNKNQFLTELEKHLKSLPAAERAEIISDYAEHFDIGTQQGRTQEEVAEALGTPAALAKQYRASYIVEQAESKLSFSNTFRAVIAVVGLGFFNLLFILAPFVFAVSILIFLAALAFSLTIVGPVLILGTVVTAISIPVFLLTNTVGLISLSTGLTSLGLLVGIGTYYLGRWFFKSTLWYLKTNVRLITGGAK